MSDHHRRVRALFIAVCDMSAAERDAFLARECDNERELQAVKRLLAADTPQSDMFAEANLGGVGHRLLSSHGRAEIEDPQPEAFLPGVEIAGRYRVASLLGHGGMGEVYGAEDLKLGVPVALKFLRPRLSDDHRALEYFLNEVRLAREVAHPNICRTYDIAEADGRHFISMEYVDGEDLQSLLRRIGRLPRDRGIEIARQICLGLAAAHAKGVLHRDLKPSNVMIDGRGQVRITDFGLAVPSAEAADGAGLVGTPAYMAPELLEGAPASVASDVYSLGLVLYELFTGERVHGAESDGEPRRAGADAPPRPLSELVANIDPDVERATLRCLERDPRQRPASARAVAAALGGRPVLEAAVLAGTTPSPELVASAEDHTEMTRTAKLAVLLGSLVGIVVIGLLSVRAQNLIGFQAETLIRPQDAADLVRSLGYDDPPLDSTWGLAWNDAYFEYFQEDAEARREWARLTGAPPTAATLWYRESAAGYLVSLWGHGPFAAMFVSPEDPPPLDPGMVSLRIDGDGRLLELVAVPTGPTVPEQSRPDDPDWLARLAHAADLDMDVIAADFVPVTESGSLPPPPVYADTRRAWQSRSGRIFIDTGAYRGRPVFFRMTVDVERAPPPVAAFQLLLGFTVLALASSAVILGRRNWLAGRADRRGTARIFGFVVITSFVYWLCQAHHVPASGEAVMILKTTARAVLRAIIVCGAYVALEPYIRRWRPHALIAWNRLIRGQVHDSVVGRSVLVGVLAGVVAQLVGAAGLVFGAGRQIVFVAQPVLSIGAGPFDLRPLTGPLSALGQISAEGFVALVTFIACPLLFFALHSILRRDWAAAIAFVLFYSSSTFLSGDLQGGATIAIVAAMGLFLFFRFGMLTVAAAWFSWRLLTWPVSLDFSAPHLDIGLLGYLVVAALALYGFRAALGPPDEAFAGTATS